MWMPLKCALGTVWITINYGCVKFEFNNKLFQYELGTYEESCITFSKLTYNKKSFYYL